MALNIVTVPERDFGSGVDTQSPPNQIQPGYVEDLLNADPKPTGPIAKRKGYQGYAGNVPVRVMEFESDGTQLEFILDSAIDLTTIRSTPIIVYGKTSTAHTGDFTTTDTAQYYASIDTDPRKTLVAGASQTLSIPATEHLLTTPAIWFGLTKSDDPVNASNTIFYPNQIQINKTTYNTDITYDNLTGSDFDAFVYFSDKSTDSPTSYFGNAAGVPDTTSSLPVGTSTFQIIAAEHNLGSSQIQVKVFQDDGTNYIEIVPDIVTINKTTAEVNVTLTNGTTGAIDIIFSLAVVPTENFVTGAVATGTSNTVSIDLSAYDAATNFVYLSCYTDDGTTLSQVIPDSIVIDTTSQTMEVSFTDSGSGGASFVIYWEFATVTSNKLRVTPNTATPAYTDLKPQMTIWGLDHAEIYGSEPADSRAGWVSHIDSYRSTGEARLVAGLGGNLYSAQLQVEGSNETTYKMPSMFPNLQALVAVDATIGPVFWDLGETPGRTRGFIRADNDGSNSFEISSITYDSGNGFVKYVISAPSLDIQGVLGTMISTSGIKDVLTVTDASFRIHNGEFSIEQVISGVDRLNIWVSNSSVTDTDWDITGAGGRAAIYTDRLTLTGTSPFISGDGLDSDLVGSTLTLSCLNSSGTALAIDGLVDVVSFPVGLKIVGSRMTQVIPLRTGAGIASVNNLVRGDMLSYTGINRLLRIKHINELSDVAVTIAVGDTVSAAVTLGSGTTDTLWVGEKILFRGGSSYNGTYEISEIVSTSVFKVLSELTATDSATLVGKTIHIDEALEWEDSTTSANEFSVVERWIPIEAPTDSYDLTESTFARYFDTNGASDQPILRSTMVKDSLYLTNGDDEVLKFDGSNLYRAGLFRWQPNLFMSVDSTSTGLIDVNNPSISTTAHSQNKVTLSAVSDKSVLKAGDTVKYSVDSLNYIIDSIQEISGTSYIYLDRAITAGTAAGTLSRISRFRYYFRLNAVDINNNIIASAVVGSSDFVAELTVDAGVRIKLVGMPAWDIYDYDRLEVQIYRTKSNTLAPFYRITTLPMSFNNGSAYIDYVDSDADDDLINLDEVSTALSGAELGTAWSEPLRAKYVTSAGNRLILGNIKDYATLDIQLLRTGASLTTANLSGLSWLFRKDNEDTGTTTNMVDRATYEFRTTAAALVIGGITASTTTFTVAHAGHTQVVGNWVYIYRDAVGSFNPKFSGWHQISSISAGVSFTIKFNSDGTVPATNPNRYIPAATSKNIPVLLGTDGNYGMLNGNTLGSEEFRAMRRLSDAINASMRATDVTITGQELFRPWMIANAGNDFESGQLVLKQPKQSDTFLEVVLPAFSSVVEMFVNSTKRTQSSSVSAIQKLFPSRIIASYANFPEIFDAPTVLNDSDSDSAIDVNAADGQEITATIPFFGESAFGAAQKSGIIVVFKTNSIYLVDLAAKDAGTNAVQKIESQGKGCTAPYSVTVTRAGIMFANETGLYRLNRSLAIDYIGRKYEGKFQENVERTALDVAAGHHDAIDNLYKLSYPIVGSIIPSNVAVYNHVREYEAQNGTDGSWTTYDNHPAIGWANLGTAAYFAATIGRVFSIRKLGEVTDYRDDDAAIAMTAITRANDFTDGGVRKVVRGIVVHYIGENSTGTTLRVARDLIDNFDQTDAFQIKKNLDDTGLGDTGEIKVNTISSVVNSSKGVYFQLKFENSTIDELVEIVGVDWRIAGLTDKGVLQARQSLTIRVN